MDRHNQHSWRELSDGAASDAPGIEPPDGMASGVPGREPPDGMGSGEPGPEPPDGMGSGTPGIEPPDGMASGVPGRQPPDGMASRFRGSGRPTVWDLESLPDRAGSVRPPLAAGRRLSDVARTRCNKLGSGAPAASRRVRER